MTAGKRADLRENSNVFFREHLPEVKSLKGPTRANAQTQNLDARPETAKGTGRKKPLTISLERYTKGRGAHKITTSTIKERTTTQEILTRAQRKSAKKLSRNRTKQQQQKTKLSDKKGQEGKIERWRTLPVRRIQSMCTMQYVCWPYRNDRLRERERGGKTKLGHYRTRAPGMLSSVR